MLYVRNLVWDSWNIEHIARHDVKPEEVNETCQNNPSVRETHSGRLLLIGKTNHNRLLAVVLAPKGTAGNYYPVTSWQASGKLLSYYEEDKRKEKGNDK